MTRQGEKQLTEYLDRIYKPGDTYENLCDNAWQMFERSVGYPPDVVASWAGARGITFESKQIVKPISNLTPIKTILTQAVVARAIPVIAPETMLAIVEELERLRQGIDAEYLSTRLPDDTTDCQSLALDYQAAIGRVSALTAENGILRGYVKGEVSWDKVEGIL